MGHYASEMHLEQSARPALPLTGTEDAWVVNDHFQVETSAEYYARKNKFGMGAYALLNTQVFKSKALATQHARKLLEQEIRNAELRLQSLNNQLEALNKS